MANKPTLTEVDIRIHALSLAVATRRDSWALSREECQGLADQVLIDATQYAEWIMSAGEPASVVPVPDEWCGDYPAPCNCDDPVTHDNAVRP